MRARTATLLVVALTFALASCESVPDNPTYDDVCPRVREQKLQELYDTAATARLDKIFWGDSVVEFMHDSRLYGLDYVDVAQSGQITFCARKEMQYVLDMQPSSVMIYIGGNDADGAAWYGPEQAAEYYTEILDRFLEHGIRPIVLQIHEASTSRDRSFVQTYNRLIAAAAAERGIDVISNLPALSFDEDRDSVRETDGRLTYDGEHLLPGGYVLWTQHIKEQLE